MELEEGGKRLTLKVVYYGPGMSGKTTNLLKLHDLLSLEHRGDLEMLDTQEDRTLFFDLLPMFFVAPSGLKVKLKVYTVPGQVRYDATRKAVLSRADGVVFVADSSVARQLNNAENFSNLEANCKALGIDLARLPLVVQYNKRDLPEAVPEAEARRRWETAGIPVVFASALNVLGVLETFEAIVRKTYRSLDATLRLTEAHGLTEEAFLRKVGAPMASPSLEKLLEAGGPLLTLLARAMHGRVAVWDEEGRFIVAFGEEGGLSEAGRPHPIRIEAETVGEIRVWPREAPEEVAKLANVILHQAYTRRLVVGMYQETLSDSYEALMVRNQELEALTASLEEQVRERTRELDRAHARLAQEEKAAAIGRLAAGVAHELNTPLACVRSNLSYLAESFPREAEAAGILKESLDMTDRAAAIVRDLRGFSHVDDLGEASLDLNREMDHALEVLKRPAEVAVERAYASPLPKVRADGKRLNIALLHLLENARDAVASGGRIRVATAAEDGHVVVQVQDSGPGIPPEVLPRVFDPFFTTKDVGGGTGLGLTVARDIVRSHGGKLTLECPPGGGTLARISLPALKEE